MQIDLAQGLLVTNIILSALWVMQALTTPVPWWTAILLACLWGVYAAVL